MSIIKSIKNYKDKLTRIGRKEPLNFFSIFLIIALDVFVLVNLFQGLDLQTRQLESPSERIPYQCMRLIDEEEIKDEDDKIDIITNILDRKPSYYSTTNNKYSANYVDEKNKEEIDLRCQKIFDAAILVYEDTDLQKRYKTIEDIEDDKRDIEKEIHQYENDYDTMLLEEIAGQDVNNSIIIGKIDDVKEKIEDREDRVADLENKIKKEENSIMQSEEVITFFGAIEKNKDGLQDSYDSLSFWYPLKKSGIQLVFLLPLLFLFIYVYRLSLRKNKEFLILIFAHLIVIALIPVVINIISTLVDVLPFHIFADILEILEALNLIMLWNYLLILGGIGVTIVLIYFVQKKLFSREKTYLKRIAQGKCFACGAKLKGNESNCYSCGEKQVINCPHCGKPTHRNGLYCVNCGKGLKE